MLSVLSVPASARPLGPIFDALAAKKGKAETWQRIAAVFENDGLLDTDDLESHRVTQAHINRLLASIELGEGYRVIIERELSMEFYTPTAEEGERARKRQKDVKAEVRSVPALCALPLLHGAAPVLPPDRGRRALSGA